MLISFTKYQSVHKETSRHSEEEISHSGEQAGLKIVMIKFPDTGHMAKIP